MPQFKDEQLFLIIKKINLFPQIHTNTISMIEQIMNALLLCSKENIQAGIEQVITLEVFCQDLLDSNYSVVLDALKPFLEQHNILVVKGDEVKLAYPLYNKPKYFSEVGKQAAIDLEFSLEKKISYDGIQITFESTYIDWVNQIVNQQRDESAYNSLDKLLYNFIEPQTTLKHIETRGIIEDETKKYAEEYRKFIVTHKAEM